MSGYYTYYEKTDGEIYIVVRGTWKNTSGDAYDIGDIASKFILNDKYNYKGQSTKERDNGTGFEPFSLNPLKSIKFVIFASVPDEAKEQFKNSKLTFGFNENISNWKSDAFEKLDNVYELEIN